jgi:hypothetical protein
LIYMYVLIRTQEYERFEIFFLFFFAF